MGVRLIDDFLARNPNISRCNDFRETADVLAKVTIEFLSKNFPICFSFSKVLKRIWASHLQLSIGQQMPMNSH